MNCFENGPVCKIIQVMETKITEAIEDLNERDKENPEVEVPIVNVKPELEKIDSIFQSESKVYKKKTIVSIMIRFFEFHMTKLERLGLDNYNQASYHDVKDFIRDRTVDIVIQDLEILTRANVRGSPDQAKIDDLLNVLACIMIVEDNEDCEQSAGMLLIAGVEVGRNRCRRNSDVTNNILKKVEGVAKSNGHSFYCIRCHRLVTWYRRHAGRPIRKFNSNQITMDKECIKKFITREENLPTLIGLIRAHFEEMLRKKQRYALYNYYHLAGPKNDVDILRCKLYYLDKLGQSDTANTLVDEFIGIIPQFKKFGNEFMSFALKNKTKQLRYKNRQEKLCFDEKEDIVEKIKQNPAVAERLKF